MEKLALTLSVTLGIISISTIIFYAGYNFRTLQSLRNTANILSSWKDGLLESLDNRFVRTDIFETKLDTISKQVSEIHRIVENRSKNRTGQ